MNCKANGSDVNVAVGEDVNAGSGVSEGAVVAVSNACGASAGLTD